MNHNTLEENLQKFKELDEHKNNLIKFDQQSRGKVSKYLDIL